MNETTEEEVEPAEPEKPKEPVYEDKKEETYRYSIDAIVNTIKAAHKKRVAVKKAEHAAVLKELKDTLKPKVLEVKKDF